MNVRIQTAGIGGLPSVINAALLTSAWSAASSDLYTSSRALCEYTAPSIRLSTDYKCAKDGLSLAGNAPAFFSRTSRTGLPYISVAFNALFASLAYLGIKAGPGKVFGCVNHSTSHPLLTALSIDGCKT